jgi:regulatory protein
LQRACNFLARREHSRQELAHKLARGCEDQGLIDELLDKLSSEGLQSDEQFTESFVSHRISCGKGPIKIYQELRQRGVEKAVIQRYLESYSIDWSSQAETARVKKFGEEIPADCAEKSKQSRFLLNRGFSSQLISQLLS